MNGKKEIIVATVVVAMVLLTLFFYLMGTGEIELNQICTRRYSHSNS